jgi:Fe2+ transport system protein B
MEKHMSDYTISIPDSVYQKARQIAQQKSLSVDEVIRVGLEGAFVESMLDIPLDEQAELKAITYLSDDALFNMMREQMQQAKQARMSALMDKNSRATITDEEYAELAALVEAGQRLTLRKATAMNYLVDRGYRLTLNDMNPVGKQTE